MNKQKAMMDALMGRGRDQSEADKRDDEFKDESYCKHYLIGFCPDALTGKQVEKERDQFSRNKFMPVPCTKTHSSAEKSNFERHPRSEEFRRQFEESLLKRLEAIIGDVDRQFAKEKRKCESPEHRVNLSESLKAKMADYEETEASMIKEAKVKGESGDVAGSQKALDEAKHCRKQYDSIIETHSYDFPGTDCCQVCAVRYLMGEKRFDTERGLSGYHYEGQHAESILHVAYTSIHAKFAELTEKRKLWEEQGDEKADSKTENGKASSAKNTEDESEDKKRKKGDRSRSRSKKRKVGRSKSFQGNDSSKKKTKDRSKSRSGDRSKKQTKDRSKSRSGDRSKKKTKDRSKSRSGDRSKTKTKGRSRSITKDHSKKKTKERSRSHSNGRSKKTQEVRKKSRSGDWSKKKKVTKSRSPSADRSKAKNHDRSKSRSDDRSKKKTHRSRSRSDNQSKKKKEV